MRLQHRRWCSKNIYKLHSQFPVNCREAGVRELALANGQHLEVVRIYGSGIYQLVGAQFGASISLSSLCLKACCRDLGALLSLLPTALKAPPKGGPPPTSQPQMTCWQQDSYCQPYCTHGAPEAQTCLAGKFECRFLDLVSQNQRLLTLCCSGVFKEGSCKGAWLGLSVDHGILHLRVGSSSLVLGLRLLKESFQRRLLQNFLEVSWVGALSGR